MDFDFELLITQSSNIFKEVACVLELLEIDMIDVNLFIILKRPNSFHNVTLFFFV